MFEARVVQRHHVLHVLDTLDLQVIGVAFPWTLATPVGGSSAQLARPSWAPQRSWRGMFPTSTPPTSTFAPRWRVVVPRGGAVGLLSFAAVRTVTCERRPTAHCCATFAGTMEAFHLKTCRAPHPPSDVEGGGTRESVSAVVLLCPHEQRRVHRRNRSPHGVLGLVE